MFNSFNNVKLVQSSFKLPMNYPIISLFSSLLAVQFTFSEVTTFDWKPSFNDEPVPQERLEAIEAALPDVALAVPDSPRKILIFSATAGFRHASIATGKVALDRMGIKTGAYQALISDDPENFEIDVLKTFDAVVLLSPTLDFFMPPNKLREDFSDAQWSWLHARHERLIANLVQFVHAGGGLVGIHAATDSCYEDEDYGLSLIHI